MKRFFAASALLAALPTAAQQGTCATAPSVILGVTNVGPVQGDPNTYCGGGTNGANAAWFRYTATMDTSVRITTNIPGYPVNDTRVSVYTGTCDALTCVAWDHDGGGSLTAMATWAVTAGTTYTIAFDNRYSTAPFAFNLTLVQPPPPPPPALITFTNVIIPNASGIQGAVDMNNDGRDDAVMPGYASFKVAYQGEDAAYTTVTFPTTNAANTASWSFAVGDWDSNGHRDLLYGGGSGATFMTANADGSAYTQFSPTQYIFSQRTNFVDINLDGHLDAFVCHDVDANVAFINNGAGQLVHTQGGYGTTCGNYGSIFTDIDNDGAMDLFVAKCGCDPTDLMMLNNGSGGFANIAPAQGLADGHQSWSSAWGDFDNDGDMDVLIGSSGGGAHKLMLNDGAGNFTNGTAGSGMDLVAGSSIEWTAHDFDNNGYVDILGGGGLHLNNGDGTFTTGNTSTGNHAVGDMDGDGFLDVCTGNGYQRNNGNANNWIRIIPVGVVSNRDAIGARVTITSALGTQIRDIRSGDGFRYMSFIGAHFGLGSDTEVEEVSIRWPNGTVEVLKAPAINAVHTIYEGLTTSVTDRAEDAALRAVPNPAQERISFAGAPVGALLEVLDATGRIALSTRYQGILDIQALTPGLYVARINGPGGTAQLRFTKD